MYISRTEGVSSGFHQKWCCSHKHGLHAWFPFVILNFSPRSVELNDGHFFFPRMDWASGRSFADEPPTIRLGTRRHMRALWRLRVTTCQEEEIFWMYFLGWLDGCYWTMSQSKDFCCVYSCSNFKRNNLLQSSQMLLVVEIMLQQQHVLHKGPQPHQTSIPKAQNMLQISA